MDKSAKTLKAALENLGPIVQGLRELKRDLRGLERQFARVPRECITDIPPLDDVEARLAKRYAALVGAAPRTNPPVATVDIVEDLLRTIRSLADEAGVEIGTDDLPEKIRPTWTDDPTFYETEPTVEAHSGRWLFAPGRTLRLADDGSLPGYRG